MIPSLIEPPELYILVVFSLLTLVFIIGFTNSYLNNKKSDRTNSSVEEDRHPSNECNNFPNLIRCEPSDGQPNNESSQLSVSSSDVPPKYEPPPSYSETIYSINIWSKLAFNTSAVAHPLTRL